MARLEDLVPDAVVRPEDAVHLLHLAEGMAERIDRKDVVLRPGLAEQRARGDEPGHVVHLAPLEDAGHVVVDAVRDAEDRVAEGVEVAADQRRRDARLQRGAERRHRAAATDSHEPDPARVDLRARLQIIDGAHHIPDAPSEHGFPEQQGGAGRRLAGGLAEAAAPAGRIAAAAEAKRLDGEGGEAALGGLHREVVLIRPLLFAVLPFLVDAGDVIGAAAVPGNADQGRRGCGLFFGTKKYPKTPRPGRDSKITLSRV